MEDFDWTQLEREAREQARRDLDALLAKPVDVGQHVAWTEMASCGKTGGLSIVHRVGVVETDAKSVFGGETLCGEQIPGPARWITLTPGWLRTQKRCKWCEIEYGKSLAQQAAS